MVQKIKYDKDEWLQDTIEKTLTAEEIELLEKALPLLRKLVENK
jgi:hypothetical protein